MANQLNSLAGQAHIWSCAVEALDATGEEPLLRLIGEGQRERLAAMRFAADRAAWLTAQLLLRRALSHYHPAVAPQQWGFVQGEHGKPRLADGQLPPLRFNLSHTRDMCACVVTLGRECGIDIESQSRRLDYLALARRYFTAEELAALQGLSAESLQRRFFDYWVLKEAYAKACGRGLGVGLQRYAFTLQGDAVSAVWFDAALGDTPRHWHFALHRHIPGHACATAVAAGEDGGEDGEPVIVTRPTTLAALLNGAPLDAC